APKGIDSGLHDARRAFERGHGFAVRRGLAAGGTDLLRHGLARVAGTTSIDFAAGVVDQHLGAVLGEQQRVRPADASDAAVPDRNLVVQEFHVFTSTRVAGYDSSHGAIPVLRSPVCVPDACPATRAASDAAAATRWPRRWARWPSSAPHPAQG